MITDQEADELNALVIALSDGAKPVEQAMVTVLAAILTELRSVRKFNEQFAQQFNTVSAGGNALLTETRY